MMVLLGIYLVLAWVFASWTRPVVVMAIIPFGLVGTIYGHRVWDVPLSMFTVVGLLGMTGIIINDSIVLVTQIDRYAADRGLIPSIIDGAADRLRPVFLTTATTVLGLVPLLYEQSSDAQFLKPTVITLVYGLGFGMVLVLLVVPALIAVQHDLATRMTALRRGLRFRVAGLRGHDAGRPCGGSRLARRHDGPCRGDGYAARGAATARAAGVAPLSAAFALFVVGAAAISLLVYLAGGAALLLRSRRPRDRDQSQPRMSTAMPCQHCDPHAGAVEREGAAVSVDQPGFGDERAVLPSGSPGRRPRHAGPSSRSPRVDRTGPLQVDHRLQPSPPSPIDTAQRTAPPGFGAGERSVARAAAIAGPAAPHPPAARPTPKLSPGCRHPGRCPARSAVEPRRRPARDGHPAAG